MSSPIDIVDPETRIDSVNLDPIPIPVEAVSPSPRRGRLARIGSWFVRRRDQILIALVATGLIGTVAIRQVAVRHWGSAEAALADERPGDARQELEFCLRVWPRNPDVHFLAARAARLAGDLADTEAHLNRCIEIQGPSERVQLEFLLLRVQAGEVDELAPILINSARDGHPELPIILETLARSFILHLRYRPAYACLSLWIEKRPDAARPLQWRGWVLERLNNQKAATVDYHKALELDPELLPVRLRVAEMLLEDKQAPEALPHLERLLRQAPNDPQVQARMGSCLFLQGELGRARTLMESAVERLPHDPVLLVSLAELNLQDERFGEAEALLRRVLANDPSDTEALHKLANVLQVQGKLEDSAKTLAEYERKRIVVERTNELLKTVADSRSPSSDNCAEIGRMLLEIGRKKLGVYWCEQALEKDPRHPVANRALADHYEREGDATRAGDYRRQLSGTTR